MEFNDVDNIREQLPNLLSNLSNKGCLSLFDVVKQVELMLDGVVKFNLKEEQTLLMESLIPFVQKEKYSSQYNVPLHIFEKLTDYRKTKFENEIKEVAALLSDRFFRDTESTEDLKDIHDIMEMGISLSQYYGKKKDYSDVERILNIVIDCIENNDDVPGLRAVGLYRDILSEALNLGRRKIVDRINRILEKNTSHVKEDMTQFSQKITIPQELIDIDYLQFTEGRTTEESYFSFAFKNVPDESKIKEYSKQMATSCLNMFRHFYFNTDGTLAHDSLADNGSNDKEDIQYSTMLQFYTIILHANITKGMETGLFSINKIMDYACNSTILSSRRIQIIEKGVSSYFNTDYITSMSILIPQIEYMVRAILKSKGYIVTDNDKIGTTNDALGTLLNNDDIIVFDKNISRYLRTILSNRTGWNLRNLYCHGISDSFSMVQADRVFHIVILLLALTQKESGL